MWLITNFLIDTLPIPIDYGLEEILTIIKCSKQI